MSLVITSAASDGSLVFDFKTFDSHNISPDAYAIAQSGGDPYLINPDYIEGAGFDLSEGSFKQILGELYLDRELRSIDITMLRDACDAYLTQKIAIELEDTFGQLAMRLHALCVAGIAKGATQVVALSS